MKMLLFGLALIVVFSVAAILVIHNPGAFALPPLRLK
jgi:hypothetical protein